MFAHQDPKKTILASPASRHWQHIHIESHHGIVIPLFSLHSKTSCGIGEYADLIPMIEWCRDIGFTIIQLLPLNDTGVETSPYSALSAYALNPIHLSLSRLPHLDANSDLKHRIKTLQQATDQTQRLDYHQIHNRRDAFTRSYYSCYGSVIFADDSYQLFKKEQAFWLGDYTTFKALKIFQKWKPWEEWPIQFQRASASLLHSLPREILDEAEYHSFLQFLCFQQFEEVKRHAEKNNLYLKGDIPILINRDSADVWRHPNQFSMEFAAGAPPDMYSSDGQKWGFPLYNWEVMAADHYRWWIERLNVASHFYHLYRIDHIVGFFRIWAIPLDLPAKFGHYIPVDEKKWIPQGEAIMRAMLANCSMLPIGEDLGVIPPTVKESLQKLGICGTKVMRWERYWDGDQSFIDPNDYSLESMTTVSTHDSETLKLWWENYPEEAKMWAQSFQSEYSFELTKAQHFAILLASHQSKSLFHINLLQEYLALIPHMTWSNPEDERINIPGIISDKNWTYRFLPSVEEIIGNAELKKIMLSFSAC